MAQLTAETMRRLAREIFDYELEDGDAHGLANTSGAMLTMSRHLGTLGLDGIQPPFGYPNLTAEASQLKKKA